MIIIIWKLSKLFMKFYYENALANPWVENENTQVLVLKMKDKIIKLERW